MTTLIQKLRADALQARKEASTKNDDLKAKIASTLLVTLVSEAARVGKDEGDREPTDAEVAKVIKKFLDGIQDTLAALVKTGKANTDPRVAQLLAEQELLTAYAPPKLPQMSDDALSAAIQAIVSALPEKSMKQMGAVMKALKDQYDGQYNATTASTLVRAALS